MGFQNILEARDFVLDVSVCVLCVSVCVCAVCVCVCVCLREREMHTSHHPRLRTGPPHILTTVQYRMKTLWKDMCLLQSVCFPCGGYCHLSSHPSLPPSVPTPSPFTLSTSSSLLITHPPLPLSSVPTVTSAPCSQRKVKVQVDLVTLDRELLSIFPTYVSQLLFLR